MTNKELEAFAAELSRVVREHVQVKIDAVTAALLERIGELDRRLAEIEEHVTRPERELP